MDDSIKLELHYYFDDDTHTMDAFVRNKCEAEVLAIAKEIISTYTDEEVVILTEPSKEGGLVESLNFLAANKDAFLAAGIPLTLLVSIITLVLSRRPAIHPEQLKLMQAQQDQIQNQNKLTEAQTKVADSQAEINELTKEKLKLEIGKLNTEELERIAEQCAKEMDSKLRVIKRKSNFYKALQSTPKVTKVKATALDGEQPVVKAKVIDRVDFPRYILNTDKLPKSKDEDATLEILSPVLNAENDMKWRGYYNGQPISFKMKDKVFKKMVASGAVNLHDGYLVKCELNYVPIIKLDGTVENNNYSVSLIKGEITDKGFIESWHAKNHRLKQEALRRASETSQASLFGPEDDPYSYKYKPEIKPFLPPSNNPSLDSSQGPSFTPPKIR